MVRDLASVRNRPGTAAASHRNRAGSAYREQRCSRGADVRWSWGQEPEAAGTHVAGLLAEAEACFRDPEAAVMLRRLRGERGLPPGAPPGPTSQGSEAAAHAGAARGPDAHPRASASVEEPAPHTSPVLAIGHGERSRLLEPTPEDLLRFANAWPNGVVRLKHPDDSVSYGIIFQRGQQEVWVANVAAPTSAHDGAIGVLTMPRNDRPRVPRTTLLEDALPIHDARDSSCRGARARPAGPSRRPTPDGRGDSGDRPPPGAVTASRPLRPPRPPFRRPPRGAGGA